MNFEIINMQQEHKSEVLGMMETFYSSDAVFTNGSKTIFENDFACCIENSPYLEGYIFKSGFNILGYAMIAKSFSTEFGKKCVWLEDLYIKPEYRGNGIIKEFFQFIEQKYKNTILRLEVEHENSHAVHVYEKNGFTYLTYEQMKKEV